MPDDTPGYTLDGDTMSVGDPPPVRRGKKPSNGGGMPALDLSALKLPTDPGELQEHLRQEGIRAIAEATALVRRFTGQLATMDLDKAHPHSLATSLGTLLKQLGQTHELLSTIAPRIINVSFAYPKLQKGKKCPFCGDDTPGRDLTGFDEPDDDG